MHNCAELERTPDADSLKTVKHSQSHLGMELVASYWHAWCSHINHAKRVLYKLCAWVCPLLATMKRMPCVPCRRNLGELLQPVQARASCRPL